MQIHRTPAWGITRDRILDAARDLVVNHGWDRFSLRALARAVKLSPASLYEYFDGKDAILEAVADRARHRLVDELRAVPADHPQRLVELSMAYVAFARRYREDFLLLYARPNEQPPGKGTPYSIWLHQVARELGPGRKREVPRLAYTVWACAHGLAMLQITALANVDGDFEASDRAAITAMVAAI